MPKSQRSKPPVIPCERRIALKEQIEEFAEVLKTQAHTLGAHGLTEAGFYSSGLLAGAIQKIRGEYSATMIAKRDFVARVLRHMEDAGYVKEWVSSGSANRHDYTVTMTGGRIAVIELKGCLDGNNSGIFERPPHAQEFIVWSVCDSQSNDPRHSVWSGVHVRLGVKMIAEAQQVDGLVVWDWLCGTPARPCPKLARKEGRLTTVGQFQLTPPCIYLFPRTIPSVRNNPNPEPHKLEDVAFLAALNECFGGYFDEINNVRFLVTHKGSETVRTTSIERSSVTQHASRPTAIRRK
jgi:hypothetical protein